MLKSSRVRGALLVVAAMVGSMLSLTAPAEAVTTVRTMTIKRTTPGIVSTGSRQTFTGTAPRTLVGKTVRLQRLVNSGLWVTVASARVRSGGLLAANAVATGVGVNRWRWRYATRTRIQQSPVLSVRVWGWYAMTTDNAAYGGGEFTSQSAAIGGSYFTRAVTNSYPDGEDISWNLSYRCLRFSSSYGLSNKSDTGSSATFAFDLDGQAIGLETKSLGAPSRIDQDVSSRMRITLTNDDVKDGLASIAAWGNPRVLCSGNPF